MTAVYVALPWTWRVTGFGSGVDVYWFWDSSPAANTEPGPSVPTTGHLLL